MANILADHRRGDTFKGISFLVRELQDDNVTKTPVDLTDVVILAQFKTSVGAPVASFEFKTSDDTITVPNPLSGEFFFMRRAIKVLPALYVYDIQLTFSDETVETIVTDKWLIYEDISR